MAMSYSDNRSSAFKVPSGRYALRIKSLAFGYDARGSVLEVEHLDIKQNKIVSLLGPSGCGKTTLLLLIAGLLKPSQGTLRIFDRDPESIRRTGAMSMVFQNAALLPWRTVEENLELPFHLRGETCPSSKIQNTLDLVGLTEHGRAYVDQLSGGMQSRVALARALITEPSVLLMDEPFGNLDEFTRVKLNLALDEIQDRLKMTVVFITHNINEAVLIADRILVMDRNPPNKYSEIIADIDVDFPNKSVEAQSKPEYQATYQSILSFFQKGS